MHLIFRLSSESALTWPIFNVCVVGGYGGDKRSTHCYDIFSGVFNTPNMDIPQFSKTIGEAGDLQAEERLWIMGGKYDGDLSRKTFYLNPSDTEWIEGPTLVYPVRRAEGAATNRALYLVGGEYYGYPTWFTQVLLPRLPIGDTDNDGDIDGSDLARFSFVFRNQIDPDADLNEDRAIDVGDVQAFAENMGG